MRGKAGISAGMSACVRRLLLFLLALPATLAPAQPRALEEGLDFARLDPPLATEAGSERIEILDVFWYGCPVCAEFEPMMSYWGGEIRGDLVLRRLPAVWNPVMRLHAQLYYTALALELGPAVHREAFRRIHEQHDALNHADAIRAWLTGFGPAAAAVDAAWHSSAVADAVALAEQQTRAAGIDRLPALLVNGRYRVVRNARLRELPELVIAVNELIRRERDLRRPD